MRRGSEPVSLFPFLSVLAAALGTLTLIISGMGVLSFGDVEQYVEPMRGGHGKRPHYVECRESGLLIHPEGIAITMAQLRETTVWEDVLDKIETGAKGQYLILLVRPGGLGAFKLAERAAALRGIEYGYEPVYAAGPITVGRKGER